MIRAQGGDPDAPLPRARETEVVRAAADGVLTRLDAMAVGLAAWRLGAGRARREDAVQAGAGVSCTRSRATGSARATPSSPCTPTPRSGSSGRARRWRAASRRRRARRADAAGDRPHRLTLTRARAREEPVEGPGSRPEPV